MEYLDELTFQALDRYFSVLQKTGYIQYKDVDKLILLIFLQEIIDQYPYYVTESDYNIINDILVCLYGSTCLIPYSQYQKVSEPIDNYIINTPIRISEDSDIRTSQEDNIRLIND